MPANLDSLFHKVGNTTSTPIWVGGGSEPQSGGTFRFKKKLHSQMALNRAVFGSTYITQNVATSMPSLTGQSCSDSLPAVYLAKQVGTIYRPAEHLKTPDRPVNEASVKVDL